MPQPPRARPSRGTGPAVFGPGMRRGAPGRSGDTVAAPEAVAPGSPPPTGPAGTAPPPPPTVSAAHSATGPGAEEPASGQYNTAPHNTRPHDATPHNTGVRIADARAADAQDRGDAAAHGGVAHGSGPQEAGTFGSGPAAPASGPSMQVPGPVADPPQRMTVGFAPAAGFAGGAPGRLVSITRTLFVTLYVISFAAPVVFLWIPAGLYAFVVLGWVVFGAAAAAGAALVFEAREHDGIAAGVKALLPLGAMYLVVGGCLRGFAGTAARGEGAEFWPLGFVGVPIAAFVLWRLGRMLREMVVVYSATGWQGSYARTKIAQQGTGSFVGGRVVDALALVLGLLLSVTVFSTGGGY